MSQKNKEIISGTRVERLLAFLRGNRRYVDKRKQAETNHPGPAGLREQPHWAARQLELRGLRHYLGLLESLAISFQVGARGPAEV